MKIVSKELVLTISLLASVPSAYAGPYWGIELGESKLDVDTIFTGIGSYDTDVSMTGLTARLGYAPSDYLGLEARLGFTRDNNWVLRDDTGTRLMDGEVEVERFASILIKAGFNPAERVKLYLLGGYSNARLDLETKNPSAWSVKKTLSGVSYGAGIEFYGTEHTALNLEWVHILDDDDVKIDSDTKIDAVFDSVNIGIISHF